ncbi:hypothetical protein E4T52_04331 [Aureobasidium sp. EXF-3400]|nr:hypothetical protein E4T51_06019 [Aureobasidium sp. EXF-12344]KAI4780735.1 hypothetical protein E4T52_04331 [Aureobasidium sp. EXF-3400]
MARTETPKKRVSNLVGRFEQLAQSSPVQEYTYPSPESPTSPRPASQHGDKTWVYDRRCLSLSSKPSAPCLSIRLERELTRNAKLRQEIEDLRLHCIEGDEILTMLSQRLEAGTELQASLHMQTSGLQTKVDRLADKLARRDRIQKAEYERRIVAVANERDMLASKLRMADASVERARALEDTVKSADEKARIAEEKAQIADNRLTTMRSQLLGLKTNIAARSGFPADVSDQEILDMMNKLNHLVQNWCVSSFRKIKIDPRRMVHRFEKIAALQKAKSLRKLYATFDTSIKIFTFQATVLHLFMPIFDAHFFGLPEELKGLDSAAWEMESFNEWRAMTYDLLRNGDDEMKKRCQASQANAQTQIVEQVCKTMSTLTGTTVLEEQKRTLSILVEHAVSLSQLLGSQRATYRCFLPQANEQGVLKFENSAMENLMDEQESDGVAKDVRCVVSPALIKQGGERGEKMEVENVLVKAKVLCVEEDLDDDDMIE